MEIGQLLGYKQSEINHMMWENYCRIDSQKKLIKTPGIRKGFFEKIPLFIPFVSSLLFSFVAYEKELFNLGTICYVAIFFLIAFLSLSIYVVIAFKNKTDKKIINNLSKTGYINQIVLKEESNGNLLDYFSKIDYIDQHILENKEPKKVIFLDRDGTIHKDKVNTYIIEDLSYFPDTFLALSKLSRMGYYFVIVTNQDGIRKGKYDNNQMHLFNQKIVQDFNNNGIKIAAIYYSPYEESDCHYSYKPNPGMLIRAKYELNISMEDSFFIGDQVTDVIAGYRANVKTLMVTSGIYNKPYEEDLNYQKISPPTFKDLSECVEYITKQ